MWRKEGKPLRKNTPMGEINRFPYNPYSHYSKSSTKMLTMLDGFSSRLTSSLTYFDFIHNYAIIRISFIFLSIQFHPKSKGSKKPLSKMKLSFEKSESYLESM